MRLTRETEIAISILITCARARGRLLRTETIAASCGASKDHAAQVVSQLARIGWLESHRGRFGGLTLAGGMERLSVGEVVRTFQPPWKERTVTMRGLDRLLNEAERLKLDYLDRFTVADLVNDVTAERCPDASGRDGPRITANASATVPAMMVQTGSERVHSI